jgi:hypothetical protein
MEYLALIGSIMLAFVSGIFYGEKESIIRKRWQTPNWITWADKSWFPRALRYWWESNNWYYKNPLIDTLMRYPLALLKDGYHLCGTLSVVFLGLSIATANYQDFFNIYLMVALSLFWHGIGVNASYHDWIDSL